MGRECLVDAKFHSKQLLNLCQQTGGSKMSARSVYWGELRREEIHQISKQHSVVIVPVSSLEQHANHLPTNTDTNICCEIAHMAALSVSSFPVLVMPPVWTGYSPHHMKYPGSITLKYQTLMNLLSEIATSIAHHGFDKILFLNAHGGNTPIVKSLQTKLTYEDKVTAIGLDYWELPLIPERMAEICTTDKGFVCHAGEVETSLQLYLQRELVDESSKEWTEGMNGNPSEATTEKGRLIFEACVEAVVTFIQEYQNGTIEDRSRWKKNVPI
jgi:creatinine amidohydrolase